MLHSELNLDGLPGPTHGFGGLSFGNLASTKNKAGSSNPRAAALQGLDKMAILVSLGVPQGILPPHDRPNVPLLRSLGFTGSDEQVLEKVWKHDPDLLRQASSASAMWTANAATVCPSADALDGKLHITPANLASQFHRSVEPPATARLLRSIFPGPQFVHHDPLPSHATLGDEGAANHIRLGMDGPGVQLFVHGPASATHFPARQTRRASEAVARLNQVRNVIFLEQSPAAIDAGAFHNDVIAMGSADVLVAHEHSFTISLDELASRLPGITVLGVTESELPLADAISSYLFNSQLVPVKDGSLALIAPDEVHDHLWANAVARGIMYAGTRIKYLRYAELNQSMRNGGGPACLRLRVPISTVELGAIAESTLCTTALLDRLRKFVTEKYRDELHPSDLADPLFFRETRIVLEELASMLGLPGWY